MAGEYAPDLRASRRNPHHRAGGLGRRPSPCPLSELDSGEDDSQFVEIQGLVRTVRTDALDYTYVEMVTGGGRLTVCRHGVPAEQRAGLVDSIIQVRGVCLSNFNRQRQLLSFWLMVPEQENLVVLEGARWRVSPRPCKASAACSSSRTPEGMYSGIASKWPER